MSSNRMIRRSQVISPFGVGAIYDIGNESLVSCDISTWGSSGVVIHLERLEKRLRVDEFRMSPVTENLWQKKGPTLEFHRFPGWLFCSSCRAMYKWSVNKEKEGRVPECEGNNCKRKKSILVPMRFILACTGGHLMDLPWDKWVHEKQNIAKNGKCEKKDLKFITKKNMGSGLGSLEIFCESCKMSRTLDGITRKDSMKSLQNCYGNQPWQFGSDEPCGLTPQVLQRGASNVYYPMIKSALDIPLKVRDRSKDEKIELIKDDSNFKYVARINRSSEDGLNATILKQFAEDIANKYQCDVSLVLELWSGSSDEDEGDAGDIPFSDQEILAEEWPLLFNPPQDQSLADLFIGEIVKDTRNDEYGILKYIDRIVLLHKLREVRVFKGFHRVEPGDEDDENMVPADLGKGKNWLPGIEVFGEGIFFAFKEPSLQKWIESENQSIENRINPMIKRWEDRPLRFLPAPHARFVMLHTFAHLLIRQLSFDCGYSASSLKERIYSTDPSDGSSTPMSGILIYTADSDSEGSLGGLVRQGFPDRLFPTIRSALLKSSWCSSDPICTELGGQGLMGLNQAACHGCALVSETSCCYSNVLLDRTLVTGRSDISGRPGFFSDLLDLIEAKL